MRLTSRGLLLAATVLIAAAGSHAQAQNLLKPGQGLVGAPQPIETDPNADKPKEGVTELPQLDVNGKRDPLSEADKKLRDKKKRLPGLGTEQERNKDRLDKLNEWYQTLAKSPNDLKPDQQENLNRIFDDDVHRENPGLPALTPPRRNPADYRDPIVTQEGK